MVFWILFFLIWFIYIETWQHFIVINIKQSYFLSL